METIYEESPNKECSKFKNNQTNPDFNVNVGFNKNTTPPVIFFTFKPEI